jgi:hypothetical protein
MKLMNRFGLVVAVVLVLGVCSCQEIKSVLGGKPKVEQPKYAAELRDLKWDTGNFITWGGDQKNVFPTRPGNLNGIICIIEKNGNDVACEFIRPGYHRQHLNNAWGNDAHRLTVTKPGDTVEVYIAALTPDGKHVDRSLRTNPMPLVWRARR